MLERVWRKGSSLTLLVGIYTGTTTMQNSTEFLFKKLRKFCSFHVSSHILSLSGVVRIQSGVRGSKCSLTWDTGPWAFGRPLILTCRCPRWLLIRSWKDGYTLNSILSVWLLKIGTGWVRKRGNSLECAKRMRYPETDEKFVTFIYHKSLFGQPSLQFSFSHLIYHIYFWPSAMCVMRHPLH